MNLLPWLLVDDYLPVCKVCQCMAVLQAGPRNRHCILSLKKTKIYFDEFDFWVFVLFNDAWSQKGHLASYTTVIFALSYLYFDGLLCNRKYYNHFYVSRQPIIWSNSDPYTSSNWLMTATNYCKPTCKYSPLGIGRTLYDHQQRSYNYNIPYFQRAILGVGLYMR